jgi:hypothetical protein
MAEQENRTKKIHYRHASYLQPSPMTLQAMLTDAIKSRSKVSERYRLLSTGNDDELTKSVEKEFINTHITRFGMFFGNLLRYEAGANKHIVTIDDSASALSLEQIVPPKADGKQREFLDSILYFGVFNDHLVVLQSASLRTKELEKYLNWLLVETGHFDTNQWVTLEQHLTKEATDKIVKTPVKTIKIGAPFSDAKVDLKAASESDPSHVVKVPETKKVSFFKTGRAGAVLEALGLNQGTLTDDLTKGVDSDSNIEVRVEISYKYSAKGDTQKILNNLTKALRHTDIEDYEVEFQGAGTLKADKLILSADISLKFCNGLVDEEDFYLKVHNWVRLRVLDGVLEV